MLGAAGCVFALDEADELLGAAARPGRGAAWLGSALARRVAGEPLELLVGEVVFGGLRLAVAPGVFVPRARTELLVELALEGLPDGGRVVDLCGGVGAVAALVAHRRADAQVVTSDVDERASACARTNLAAYGPRASVRTGDLYAALPPALRGRVDVVVANAPYVPTDRIADLPREARVHEPRRALDGGADGTELQRRVVAGVAPWLRDDGRVVVECAPDQVPVLAAALAGAGLAVATREDDERGALAVVGWRGAAGDRGRGRAAGDPSTP